MAPDTRPAVNCTVPLRAVHATFTGPLSRGRFRRWGAVERSPAPVGSRRAVGGDRPPRYLLLVPRGRLSADRPPRLRSRRSAGCGAAQGYYPAIAGHVLGRLGRAAAAAPARTGCPYLFEVLALGAAEPPPGRVRGGRRWSARARCSAGERPAGPYAVLPGHPLPAASAGREPGPLPSGIESLDAGRALDRAAAGAVATGAGSEDRPWVAALARGGRRAATRELALPGARCWAWSLALHRRAGPSPVAGRRPWSRRPGWASTSSWPSASGSAARHRGGRSSGSGIPPPVGDLDAARSAGRWAVGLVPWALAAVAGACARRLGRAGRRRCSAMPAPGRRWSNRPVLGDPGHAPSCSSGRASSVGDRRSDAPRGAPGSPQWNGAAPAGRHDPRRARLLPVQGRRRPGHLRRQGEVAAPAAVELLPEPHLPPRTAQMVATAETVEWIQVRNDVEALMLEYSLIKQHRPRFNVRLRDDKSYPFLAVTIDDEWPRPMVMRGAQAQGRPLLRALRPRLRDPRDARPAAAHLPAAHVLATTSSTATSGSGRPCLLFHIEKCSGPCVGEIDKDALRRARRRAARVPRRRHRHGRRSGSRPQMREAADELEFERAARLPRPADQRAQGHREAADGGRAQRGLRRDRHRRRRARGRGAGVLRAQGPGGRPQGLRRSTRSRTSARPSWSSSVLEGLYDEPPPLGVPKQVLVPRRARRRSTLYERVAHRAAGLARSTIRVPAAGRQAGAAGDGHQQRQGGVRPPPAAAGQPTTTAGPRRSTSCRTHLGLPEAPLRIECYDMSHIQGTRLRRLDGGDRGRPAEEVASTAASRSRASRATTTSRRWRRCSPAASPPTWPSGAGRSTERTGKFSVPAAAAAGRRRQGPARRGRAGARGARAGRRDPGGLAGQAVRGGLRARARPTRSACPASPRRSTCCSGSATRPTGSPSPTTASCGASA